MYSMQRGVPKTVQSIPSLAVGPVEIPSLTELPQYIFLASLKKKKKVVMGLSVKKKKKKLVFFTFSWKEFCGRWSLFLIPSCR